MGRSQHGRKSNRIIKGKTIFGIKVGSIFPRKGRLATPARKSTASIKQRMPTTLCPSVERRGSLRLSPIHEFSDHDESVTSTEERRNPPSQMLWKETISSVTTISTNPDISDTIMPSGVSSFLLDLMDSSSPATPPCWNNTDTSLPSPEIFRRADDEEPLQFSVEEVIELQVKNSTLLDLSHAAHINMRQPPDISSILEVSRKQDEVDHETRYQAGNIGSTFVVCSPAVSGTLQTRMKMASTSFKQPKKIQRARPSKCRKVITFFEPLIKQEVEQVEDKTTKPYAIKVAKKSASSITGTESGLSFLDMSSDLPLVEDLLSSPIMVDTKEEQRANSSGDDTQSSSHEASPKQARFFDFSDSMEKNAFLQKKRGKLPFVFPSRPPIVSSALVPGEMEPVYLKFTNSELHDPTKLHEVAWIQLVHEGENFLKNSHLKKVVTEEGIFYEDYRKVRQFHGKVFFPISEG